MENIVLPDPVIYDSLTALDDYLDCIRIRREQRRQVRLEVDRLQISLQKVGEELEAVLLEDDPELAAELQYVLREFTCRLERLQPHDSQRAMSQPLPSVIELPVPQGPLHEEKALSDTADPERIYAVCTVQENRTESREPDETTEAIAPALTEEEQKARKQAWLAEIEALAARWAELDAEGLQREDRILNRPACFRMRSLACMLARVQTQAEDAGMASQITKAVTQLRDRMELARTYAGDATDVLPFDKAALSHAESRLSAEAWEDLAHLYSAAAEGQEVVDWRQRTGEEPGLGTLRSLLNAVGAAQQMLFRALEDYGGVDKLQADLYGSLREAANKVGFLSSLHPEATWEELDALAQTLTEHFTRAKEEAASGREKREKEARKAAAIKAIQQWGMEYSLLSSSEASAAVGREKLLPMLETCIAAGVPPTNVQVRGALLDAAPTLLKDRPAYAKFLDAVLAERKRKGMDALPLPEQEDALDEEDLPDAQVTESKKYVRLILEGQQVMILGGSARPLVAQKLKDLLGCTEVEWADSKKGDRMNKFKTTIARTDVVVVVKKFASHEMTEKGRDWAKEMGKMFVLLPSGYGVNQIIHQMHLQLVPEAGKRAELPAPRSYVSSIANLNLSSV